ncbi:hypothetical protein A2384_00005 [Candidatus Peribacteria bacterium RIFOXYB1_FULL_54_35]|nr:MAG: hypothetical protein A2198_02020 [Candidatus Peribacteria bacterium RIFOXYA1_FULL_56_14]OGJ75276.1 MAG: hypothetical protein A2384_00005 [Candidatus Peribacteria bacterium RIFOXYB1_FULL_54_35]OGJ83034.1 MAG: hypothetical protein A2598_05550 [Candidatus Peribacteria bacterium RIFOXYD1_FULL_54_13]
MGKLLHVLGHVPGAFFEMLPDACRRLRHEKPDCFSRICRTEPRLAVRPGMASSSHLGVVLFQEKNVGGIYASIVIMQ